jgi:short-subunit dehydrogenase
MPEEKIDEMIATNLKGVINTTQAAVPWMMERHRGVIINVASVAGFRSSPYSALYSATKYGVVGLSHALRGELSGSGVKVCVVYPYVTGQTEFFDDGGRVIGPVYPAWWVANLIVRTARYPRRDAMVFPLRLAQLAEPVFGGLLDHAIGEVRRRNSSALDRTDAPE